MRIIQHAMTGSELTDLLRRHAGLIRKVAYAYCRDAAEREDLIQEIAFQLWRSRERYDARFAHTTWIYRIAINVAISYFRRTARHRHQEPLPEIAVDLPDPAVAQLLRWIDDLDPLDRALVLLYLDGNDHAAIAAVLGISVSNVGTKLDRIKGRLRAVAGGSHGAR